MKAKGFTLIELIVVIAIIAILAAIIAPNAFKAIEKAKISGTIGDYRAMKTGAMAYYADTGTWPTDGVTTSGLVVTDGKAGWDGPYLEKWPPLSKWGGTYIFQNDPAQDWDGVAGGDTARYVEVSSVPQTGATRVDRELDGTIDNSAGSVRYTGANNPTTLRILISTEVAVN